MSQATYLDQYIKTFYIFLLFVAAVQRGPGPPLSRDFLGYTQRQARVGRTPLDE